MPSATFELDTTDAQHAFHNSPKRFRAFVGGVGSGKTWASVIEALRQPAGSIGMMIAPTYPMMKDATLRTFLEVAEPVITAFNKSDFHAKLKNKSEVMFRSADNPDRLRGPNLGWFALDEAALMDEEAWDIMLGRLRLKPGKAWLSTTPRGFNWVYRLFAQEERDDYGIFRASSRDNPFLPEGFVESLEQKYSSAFALQEIEGEFTAIDGARIKREWLSYTDPPALELTMGVDLAISTKEGADYTAAVVVGRDRDGTVYVVDAQRTRAPFNDVLRFIQSMAAKWQPKQIVIEQVQYQAAVVQELLRKTTLPVRGVRPDRDKVTRFQPLEARYQQGLIKHARALPAEFEAELLSFPVGQHDDFVDALAYAFNALTYPGVTQSDTARQILGW